MFNKCNLQLANALAFLSLFGVLGGVSAVTLSDKSPSLLLPPDYCLIGKSHPVDKVLHENASAGQAHAANRYRELALFLPCSTLNQLRKSGESLSNTTGSIFVPIEKNKPITTEEPLQLMMHRIAVANDAQSEPTQDMTNSEKAVILGKPTYSYSGKYKLGMGTLIIANDESLEPKIQVRTVFALIDQVPVVFRLYHGYNALTEDQVFLLASETYAVNRRYFQSLRSSGF